MAKLNKDRIIKDISKLHQRSNKVTEINEEVMKAVDILTEEMESRKGCQGLSAIQVGIPISVHTIKVKSKVYVTLNLRFLLMVGLQWSNEGCESIVDRYGLWRPMYGLATYQDTDMKRHFMWLDSKHVRIAAHEIDHAKGIVISDKGRKWQFDTKKSGHYLPKGR